MALALWLHASNSMLTATTMPSAVDEIGGSPVVSYVQPMAAGMQRPAAAPPAAPAAAAAAPT